jgi:hypothetical protein
VLACVFEHRSGQLGAAMHALMQIFHVTSWGSTTKVSAAGLLRSAGVERIEHWRKTCACLLAYTKTRHVLSGAECAALP